MRIWRCLSRTTASFLEELYMTSSGVIKAQQQENPNFPEQTPKYTLWPTDIQEVRAELDEVQPAKYLWQIMGRTDLLEHSSLSNLILHFALGVSPCHWCGHVCHAHPFQQGLYNSKVVPVQETRAAGSAGISTHIHSQCARMMQKIQEWQPVTPVNPTALLALCFN